MTPMSFQSRTFLDGGFQLGQICPHRRPLAISGAIFIFYNPKVCVLCLCVVVGWWGGSAPAICWVEARDIGNHPIVHRTGSPTTIIWSRMSVGLRLRNLVLVGFVFYLCQTV